KSEYIYELENNMVLFYTSSSRDSATIIKQQVENIKANNNESIEATHHLKSQSVMMKEAMLKGELSSIGEIFEFGFIHKKKIADKISNDFLDSIYYAARNAGASGGKISGAGGGGFMIFYCPGNTRFDVINALKGFEGNIIPFTFTKYGLSHWTTNNK
ncbi:MAG: dehydrogenase, partial [Saprospiraceae bacterium]|nr:dehydrogenase [Saprospiraceae bacterium]